MKPHDRSIFLLFAAIVGLFGCAAHEHLRQGDAADLAQRPRVALDYYRRALAADPGLARNDVFAAKMKVKLFS